MTRGFPLDPRKGERVDHPHHVGLWLNHGDVNGLDFWNNSDAIKPDRRAEDGHHRPPQGSSSAKSGADEGELVVETAWMTPDDKQLLQGDDALRLPRRRRCPHHRSDHDADGARPEGRLRRQQGRRARHARDAASSSSPPTSRRSSPTRPASATPVPVLDNTGVTGKYISSEGQGRGRGLEHARQVDAARRRRRRRERHRRDPRPSVEPGLSDALARARLRALRGQSARRQAVQRSRTSFDYTLEAGKSVTFKYRVLILERAAVEGADRARIARFRAGLLTAHGEHDEKLARVARVAEGGGRCAACCSPLITTSPG